LVETRKPATFQSVPVKTKSSFSFCGLIKQSQNRDDDQDVRPAFDGALPIESASRTHGGPPENPHILHPIHGLEGSIFPGYPIGAARPFSPTLPGMKSTTLRTRKATGGPALRRRKIFSGAGPFSSFSTLFIHRHTFRRSSVCGAGFLQNLKTQSSMACTSILKALPAAVPRTIFVSLLGWMMTLLFWGTPNLSASCTTTTANGPIPT
jgi:hypothetical protein